MRITLWHNPRCSKSRAALALLQARGIQPDVVEYLATPPDADGIRAVLRRLGLPARALLRTGEAAYAELVWPMKAWTRRRWYRPWRGTPS